MMNEHIKKRLEDPNDDEDFNDSVTFDSLLNFFEDEDDSKPVAFGKITKKDVTFNDVVFFGNQFFQEDVVFEDCTFGGKFTIRSCSFDNQKEIIFKNCTFEESVEITSITNAKVKFEGKTTLGGDIKLNEIEVSFEGCHVRRQESPNADSVKIKFHNLGVHFSRCTIGKGIEVRFDESNFSTTSANSLFEEKVSFLYPLIGWGI